MPYIEKERLPNSESKLKEMIRKGVPPTLRHWVWMEVSGARKKKASHAESYYSIMVKAGEESANKKDIEMDSQHTFPEHPWLSSADGQAALRRVLQAYSVHNDRVGYVRAMNVIVGLMLVALNRNEEAAFWLLAALVEDILYPGTYSRNLEGCQVEMRALDELISTKLPRLHEHFTAIDLDISMLATDWYLCLYSLSLPSETVMRVWDALFFEGPKILFRVALALLKIYEEHMLRVKDAGELMMRMRNAAATMHQRDVLLATAFDGIGGLPMATIDRFRELKQREVEEMLAGRGIKAEVLAGAGGSSGTSPAMEKAAKEAAEKMKQGFGKFMAGVTKLADKTAEQLARMNTREDQQQPAVATGGSPAPAPVPAPAAPSAALGSPGASSEGSAVAAAAQEGAEKAPSGNPFI
ncbi:hypothetical protein VOLCADRAFT_120512 [Volvox carteri f. nagariensis]|uniref:Rab-GAP TBC domain-containing protein n=1 Tax=Volvox carteri f. nagariensis TaxID=3068 RepID=D8TMW6_VOLCA|nr:uncharacterized protein VOLCADRAFT_120512 [Volvox carteri f. nagariensis]EFJ51322.1 hypothetical protein VOLCADRAFT_120512 [Volvox carteri f. nagariensis]|eukprot:XP_002947789.1 hypothetical protein VOLCADRAFT_120512 [Volvox carteri f. nagariensis]